MDIFGSTYPDGTKNGKQKNASKSKSMDVITKLRKTSTPAMDLYEAKMNDQKEVGDVGNNPVV